MKKLFLLCLIVLSAQAMAKNEVRLVHESCKLAVHPTYTNDGLNLIVTQAANDYLTDKGYKVLSMEQARAETGNVMAIKVDLRTTIDGKKGRCKAIMSLRPTIDELDSDMLLATIIDKKGSYKTVSNKCIKQIIKNVKKYPKCGTVLDPDAEGDLPNDGSDNTDEGDIADDNSEEGNQEEGDSAGDKVRNFISGIFRK
jgi:hypothetical protein